MVHGKSYVISALNKSISMQKRPSRQSFPFSEGCYWFVYIDRTYWECVKQVRAICIANVRLPPILSQLIEWAKSQWQPKHTRPLHHTQLNQIRLIKLMATSKFEHRQKGSLTTKPNWIERNRRRTKRGCIKYWQKPKKNHKN